jgi:hypothetical protein
MGGGRKKMKRDGSKTLFAVGRREEENEKGWF